MTKDAKTVLEWKYQPKNFFEEPFKIAVVSGEVAIADGTVKGEFHGKHFDEGREFLDKIDASVRVIFQARQVQVHQEFHLAKAGMAREHADGRREVTVSARGIQAATSVGRGEIVQKNADGEVIYDSKAERLRKQQVFRDNVAVLTPEDLVLKRMLQSFGNALADKENLLIHLFEVREALESQYPGRGSGLEVQKNLPKIKGGWGDFGNLANDKPILEGRHRGLHDELRPATVEEVDSALDYAQRLIEEYVSSKV